MFLFFSPLVLVINYLRIICKISLATLAFSLIQTEAKCINFISICIKHEKIVYTHASTYVFVLYTYNYTIQIFNYPSLFCISLFLVLYKFKLYIISLFLVLYNSIQLYIICPSFFCLSLFFI